MSPFKILKFAFASLPILLLASNARAQVSFPGAELLGRPTDTSVTINVVASAAIDAYFEYGTQSGGPYTQTSPAAGAGGAGFRGGKRATGGCAERSHSQHALLLQNDLPADRHVFLDHEGGTFVLDAEAARQHVRVHGGRRFAHQHRLRQRGPVSANLAERCR